MMVEVPLEALEKTGIEQEPSPASGTTQEKMENTTAMDGGSHLQNIIVSPINSEHSELRQSDDDNGSITSKLDIKDNSSENVAKAVDAVTLPSEVVQEKHTDTPPVMTAEMGALLLSKLKSVILKGKRKPPCDTPHLMSEAVSPGSAQGTEPCLKKSKVDSDMEMLKANDSIGCILDTSITAEQVSQTLSIDPTFAQALGLTPKVMPDMITKTKCQDIQWRRETISDKPYQTIQRPSWGRMKPLKRHRDVSPEYIKKKWWLHFHTATSYASEYRDCTRNNSVRMNLKEKLYSACSSTDALSLLADLALSASNNQVPEQPDPELERKLDSSLDMCDLTKDVTSAEQESVLHALLRQPAARPSPKSPSPKGLVGSNDEVVVISEEHDYSLPPSSSLLSGSPGTSFQVPPLSDSAGLQQHHQNMYGDDIQVLHDFVCQEEDKRKDMVRRRKFRHGRTFVDKDGSIQVTRQWEENYDFNLDSKFTNDPTDQTVIRALHGPWDMDIHDTSEEVRLIVHMWIGLFYSRSTARSFQIDTNFLCSYSEEDDGLEVSSGIAPATSLQSVKANSSAPLPTITSDGFSIPKVLDLSQKDTPVVNQGPVILDLSLRNPCEKMETSDPQVNRKEIASSHENTQGIESLNATKLLKGLQASTTCRHQVEDESYRERSSSIDSNDLMISESDDDIKSINEKESKRPSQKVDAISSQSYGTFILLREEMANVCIQPKNVSGTPGILYVLQGSNNEKTEVRDSGEIRGTTEMDLVQQVVIDLTRAMENGEVNSNPDSADLLHADEHNENERKGGPHQEDVAESSPPVTHISDDSTNKESGIICDANQNEAHLAEESFKGLSPDQDENLNECGNHRPIPDGSVISVVPMVCGSASSIEDCDAVCNDKVALTKQVDSHDQSLSSRTEVMQNDQVEEIALVKEADVKKDVEDERSEKMDALVVIPVTGIEPFTQDTSDPQVMNLHDEELVPGQKEMPFIRETNHHEDVLHTEVYSTSQEHSGPTLLLAGKVTPVVDLRESNQPMVCKENGSDDRCPTPTLDEKPYDYMDHPDPYSSTSASSGDAIKNVTWKQLSRCSTPTHDELPLEQELCFESRVNNPQPGLSHCGLSLGQKQLDPDLELRTLRVLNSLDKYRCKSVHIDKSSQLETADLRLSLDQTRGSNYVPTNLSQSHISMCFSEENINDMRPEVVLASAKQELNAKASHHQEELPFHDQLQPTETDSSIPEHYSRTKELHDTSLRQDFYLFRTSHSSEILQAVHPRIDQEKPKASLQYNVGLEPRSYSQRPVMAVKPSKSDESRGDCNSMEGQIDSCVVTNTTLSTMERSTESFKGMSEGLNEIEKEGIEFSTMANWSNDQDIVDRFKLDETKLAILDALYPYKEGDISNVNNNPSSSASMQSVESGKSSRMEKFGPTNEDIEIDKQDHSVEVSASDFDYKANTVTNDSVLLDPSTSTLSRTVLNSNGKRPYSLVEQLSQRCLQHDLTQSSMEQECLIFSEQINQLLKKSKRGHSYNQDKDRLTLSCTSPMTVHFSSFEEQEDSVEHLEALPLLVGQKIKVDLSERRGMADTTEEENTVHHQGLACGNGSQTCDDLTAECAMLYKSMMNDVCAGKKLPSKTMRSRMEGFPKPDSSDRFDVSDQTKREMFESFHTVLNSVVRQSCKTKFRFYILVTTDDAFFDETKAQLEAEGHTAVQPCQFFLGEESSSSPLLIILRNEDIAEHICEVPHLLKLKKSPVVLFAGIDQPDDIVNLTHQELLTRGGFIMFERAALQALSLGNMTDMSQFLEELSKKGKWKWMMHYKDNRLLKENARLSAEAKEKMLFINRCQEAGIVEVLPYHECDHMSRDQPDYTTCLVRLQVQNISSRFAVFITDTTADGTFETNGISTMSIDSFLTISPGETFTIL